jgi:hypothetical protein
MNADPSVILAAADPTGLPAPVWLLKLLLVFTFLLHVVPMNLVLGGGLVMGWASWRGRRLAHGGDGEAGRRYGAMASRIARLMPVATAFTITLGIAPLLFLQVLYGQLFYTSSVLMAWAWLGVIGLLMIGYYGYYGVAFSKEILSWKAALLSFASAILFLAVGFIFTNNLTLMLRPEKLGPMYARSGHGLHWNLDDPTLWPRFLHFAVASLAITGLFLALVGARRAKADPATGEWIRGCGVKLFGGATLVQLGVGIWFLFALPERVRGSFLGASPGDTALLWGSVAVAVAAIFLTRKSPLLGTGAIAVTLVGMAVVRQRVRTLMLAPYFSTESLEVRPQTTVFLIFVVLLLAGLGVVAWMVWKLATARSGPQEVEAAGNGAAERAA